MDKNEIVLFETEDRQITLQVPVEQETVWLNRNQMAELFDRDVKTIGSILTMHRKRNWMGRRLSQNLRQPLSMVPSKEKHRRI